MLYALKKEDNSFIPAEKGVIGYCPDCDQKLIPKCGVFKIHHWAHKSKTNCDLRYFDGMSEWHYSWQREIKNPQPGINIEVPFKLEGDVKYKRADLKSKHGMFVEFQKSPMPFEERILRENVYKNMFWVIHKDLQNSKIWRRVATKNNPFIFVDKFDHLLLVNGGVEGGLPRDYTITKPHFINTFINGYFLTKKVLKELSYRYNKKERLAYEWGYPNCFGGFINKSYGEYQIYNCFILFNKWCGTLKEEEFLNARKKAVEILDQLVAKSYEERVIQKEKDEEFLNTRKKSAQELWLDNLTTALLAKGYVLKT
jgi:hypothetical protein